ncbi:hypothetical protein D3C71_1122990 [compost metagenome]
MGASGDVGPVFLALGVKAVALRPIKELRIHLAKVPRVGNGQGYQVHRGLGGRDHHVRAHLLRQVLVGRRVEQLQPLDHHVLMLHQRNGGAPLLPPPCALAGIELGAEETDHDFVFAHSIYLFIYLSSFNSS